jgi:hypothetical protein
MDDGLKRQPANIGAQLNSAVQLELQGHVSQPLTDFVECGPIG